MSTDLSQRYFLTGPDAVTRVLGAALDLARGEPGALDLGGPVLHPLLAPAVAACLGLTEEEVWALAYFEAYFDGERVVRLPAVDDPTGPLVEADPPPDAAALARSGPAELARLLAHSQHPGSRAALGDAGLTPPDLLLRVVPPAPEAPAAPEAHGTPRLGWTPPGVAAYRHLAVRAHERRLRAVERQMPSEALAIASEYRELQTAFEALCAQMARPGEARGAVPSHRTGCHFDMGDRYLHPDAPRPGVLFGPPDEGMVEDADVPAPARPVRCAFAGADRLVVSFPWAHFVVARADGALVACHAAVLSRLLTVDAAGDHALCTWCGSLRLLDLTTGEWQSSLPDDPPPDHLTEWAERGSLLRLRSRMSLELYELSDHPVRYDVSPDNTLAWIQDRSGIGGVYNLSTGMLELNAAWLHGPRGEVPILRAPGEDGAGGTDSEDGDEADETAEQVGGYRADRAFALDREGRFRVLAGRTFYHDGQPVFRLGFPVHAAAFSRGGDELCVAGPGEVWVIQIGDAGGAGAPPAAVTARYRIDPDALSPLLSFGPPGPRDIGALAGRPAFERLSP